MAWLKPETDQIRTALRRYAPALADERIAFLSEGWEVWAFTAGDHVFRFPKNENSVGSLNMDRALLPALGEHLSVPVPRIDIWGDEGPNGAPFAGHVMLAGAPVWPTWVRASQSMLSARTTPAPDFGRDFGRLLRELHSLPADRAKALGVPVRDAKSVRSRRIEQYEQVIRRVFPLVSCEARTYIEAMYMRAINEPAFYDFESRFTHGDLDVNTLIDDAGHMTGLIDFGQVFLGSVAVDYWLPVYGFPRLGIADQTRACLAEASISAADFERMQPELEFINFVYPLLDILYGLETDDPEYVEGGILDLNALVPFGVQCA